MRFYVIFAVGLLSGSISSLATKAAYQTKCIGLDGQERFFNKPWFVSLVMFASMSIALLVYLSGSSRPFRLRNEPIAQQRSQKGCNPTINRVTMTSIMVLAIPTILDLLGSSIQQQGLVRIPVSTFQMLKGSVLVFSAVFSIIFLKRKLTTRHTVGLSLCVLALMIVGVAALLTREDQVYVTSFEEHVIGISFVLFGQLICAAQYVLEEVLLKPPRSMPSMAVVGIEGVWGTFMMLFIVLPILAHTRGSDVYGEVENTSDSFYKLWNCLSLHVALSMFFVSCFVFNVCGVMITQHASAMHHTFLDASRTVFVWLGSVGLFYFSKEKEIGEPLTDWSWLQGVGFLFLLSGQVVYESGGDTIALDLFAEHIVSHDLKDPLL